MSLLIHEMIDTFNAGYILKKACMDALSKKRMKFLGAYQMLKLGKIC